MKNSNTHYQTSFKVDDSDGKSFVRLKKSVYGWILKKEKDRGLRAKKADFFYRCHWPELFQTNSAITPDTYLNEKAGDAWARCNIPTRTANMDARAFGIPTSASSRERGLWLSRCIISFAWNTEYLNKEPEPPHPSVPTVIRYMLGENKIYSGRLFEFQLADKPIRFW